MFFLVFFSVFYYLPAQTNLVSWNSAWKYLDNGSNQTNVWNQLNYNDAAWSSGNAELGYGDGDEATVVSYGPNSSSKYITTYFRRSFNVSNPTLYTQLLGQLVRDDGAVVYINGVEVFRSNMPGGNIGYNTVASSTISWPFEDDVHSFMCSAAMLVAGTNVIAVEVHQESGSSSDISFNLQLDASTNPVIANVVRGPYLQVATPNSVIVRWRTDVACDARVNFDQSPSTFYYTSTSPVWSTEHEVVVSGLSPWNTYYYNIGTNNTVLFGDPDMYFRTNPTAGSTGPFRFWVIGDAGEVSTEQRLVRDAYYNYNGTPHADAWIMLGDNAYDGGMDNEYQNAVFDNMYDQLLMNTPLFPAPGNHDYNNHIPFSPPPAYYDIFTLPVAGESGGVPSGTEKYYSWDYGNVHFISLDSYDENRDSTAAMANWLKADLIAANWQTFIVAYWHHPPYTKGTHDSDNPLFYDFEMVDMREQILPILENYGVDLVLCGHSHVYERSPLIDGHYGNSGSFNQSHVIDGTSGDYTLGCPYRKQTTFSRAHKGTVYAVVGCSGKTGSTQSSWPHPAMHTSTNNEKGSMILEVNQNRLDAKFLTMNGIIYDQFTIIKNAGLHSVTQVCPGDTIAMVPSWPGAHLWQPGNISADTLYASVSISTYYIATDPFGCIRDTFDVVVLPMPPCPPITSVNDPFTNGRLRLFPVPAESQSAVLISCVSLSAGQYNLQVFDATGKAVTDELLQHDGGEFNYELLPGTLMQGIYMVRLSNGRSAFTEKLIIE